MKLVKDALRAASSEGAFKSILTAWLVVSFWPPDPVTVN
jgi:hypothetical protein